jgi:RsiW-degrading membrane proteinase PrsW (M82 family)
LLFVVFGLSMGVSFLGSLVSRPGIAIVSAFLALLICIPYGLFFVWIDRNEREPWWLLALTFFWGAVLATGVSLIFNTSFGALSQALLGDPALAQQATASFSAPVVEEITKGLALLVIFFAFPRHFDNVLDGVVYGALAGLGFATYENYIYYVRQPDLGMVFQVFWIRGIVAAVGSHAIYSAVTGAGLGLFRVMRTGCVRWVFPPAALCFAMLIHFGWNTFAGFFTHGAASKIEVLALRFPLAALVLHVPFTIGVLIIAGIALYHEAKLIREYLESEDRDVVSPDDIDALVPARRRTINGLKLLFSGKLSEWNRRRKRNKLLVKLAFEKWHMRAEADREDHETAQQHAETVLSLRQRLRQHG